MFGVDTLIGDFISSFGPGKKSPGGAPKGYTWAGGGNKRGKRFYNVGANQARAKQPVKSTAGFRASPKDKYIQDAKEASRYAGKNYTF